MSYVVDFSHVRDTGTVVPTLVYTGYAPPRMMSVAVFTAISEVYEYGSTLPLPIEPAEIRTFAMSRTFLDHFIQGSSERTQAAEAEGKNPHLEYVGNFDEPS